MARTIDRLDSLQVQRCKTGTKHDGGGLYFNGDHQSWAFRYKLHGKDRWHGLGPLHTVSLLEARDKARRCRQLLLDGIDPIAARQERKHAARVAAAKPAMTFAQCATAYHAAHSPSWRHPKYVYDWLQSLEVYAHPIIGELPVDAVDTELVLRILEPIWLTKAVTAGHIRARIERTLDWAKTRKMRDGENPARWRGHLDNLLPKPKLVAKRHHPALPYAQVPVFMAKLRQRDDVTARCLAFVVLTASRLSMAVNACWREFDFTAKLWTIPGPRMKSGKELRVPLSEPALALLGKPGAAGALVFPDHNLGRPLSQAALLGLSKDLGGAGTTVHGFRSSFRDWVAEETSFPDKIAEAALAHIVGDETVRAYQRGDLLAKRRQLMTAWAGFCVPDTKVAKVAAIGQGRRRG